MIRNDTGTIPVVVPAPGIAGAGVCGTMGPRFRGDDGACKRRRDLHAAAPDRKTVR